MEIVFNEVRNHLLSFFGGLWERLLRFLSVANMLENEATFSEQKGSCDLELLGADLPVFGPSKDMKAQPAE